MHRITDPNDWMARLMNGGDMRGKVLLNLLGTN